MSVHAPSWIVTCEHGGNRVPPEYRAWFDSPQAARLLNSHRGYDPGAWEASLQFAAHLHANPERQAGQAAPQVTTVEPFQTGFHGHWIGSRTTRLLVDLNRSIGNAGLFSVFTRKQPPEAQQQLLQDWYTPYRNAVEQTIADNCRGRHRVIHLSIHTFTPRIQRHWRPFDVGLLFDPRRKLESQFCQDWLLRLQQTAPRLRVRLNEPYLGIEDGLTTFLRQHHRDGSYAGIEVEINNRYFKRSAQAQATVAAALLSALPPEGF